MNSLRLKTLFCPARLLRKPYKKFLSSRSGPFDGPVTLDRSRVYILPTKTGLIFSLLLLVLLIGSVNYDKSLGFVLTFLLVGVGNVALLATWKNLAGLTLNAGGSPPVFAGEDAVFSVQLTNTQANTRYAISIAHHGKTFETVDVQHDVFSNIHFSVKTQHRGYYDPGQFRLYTEFPMGLFVSWTVIDLSMSCLVYPTPANSLDPALVSAIEEGSQTSEGDGLEEYSGLKKYQPGESWRHISWKAMAKSNMLYSKEFSGGQPQLQWIDWDRIQADDKEERLSIMSRLVIDAKTKGYHWGLKLGETIIPPDSGNSHYHQCMRCLALYGKT